MYHPNTLIQNITMSDINPDALVKYLNEKYLAIPWSKNPELGMSQEWALNESLIQERMIIKTKKSQMV